MLVDRASEINISCGEFFIVVLCASLCGEGTLTPVQSLRTRTRPRLSTSFMSHASLFLPPPLRSSSRSSQPLERELLSRLIDYVSDTSFRQIYPASHCTPLDPRGTLIQLRAHPRGIPRFPLFCEFVCFGSFPRIQLHLLINPI
jgi:hypothetical protein